MSGIQFAGSMPMPIIDGGPNSPLAAEVALGRLNGGVPEMELDLRQFAARTAQGVMNAAFFTVASVGLK